MSCPSTIQNKISKYKFIPPSKLLKLQNKQQPKMHIQSLNDKVSCQSLNSSIDQQMSHYTSCQNIKQRENIYHQSESSKNHKTSSAALRSSEKPNLESYMNSIKDKSVEKFHKKSSEKNVFFDQKQAGKIKQLQTKIIYLVQNKKNLEEEKQRLTYQNAKLLSENNTLQVKFKSFLKKFNEMKTLVKEQEKMLSSKCTEHELIIASLKKLIDSQSSQLNFYQRQMQSENNTEIHSSHLTSYSSQIEKQYSQLSQIYEGIQKKIPEKNPQKSQLFSFSKKNRTLITPDFGCGTPNETLKQIIQEQQSANSSQIFMLNEKISRTATNQDQQECWPQQKNEQYGEDKGQQLLKEVDKYLSQWKKK